MTYIMANIGNTFSATSLAKFLKSEKRTVASETILKYIKYCCDAYLLATEETIQREFGVYDSIRDNFPKYVFSLDEFDLSRNGIKHFNIRDFLYLKNGRNRINEIIINRETDKKDPPGNSRQILL